eukprot:Em0016g508a
MIEATSDPTSFEVSDVSESKIAVEGHSVVVDQQSASVPTASAQYAQYEPVSKDGTTNSIGTSANAAVAEIGATKAALPQHVPGSDSDSRNGAQIPDGDIDSRIGAQSKASDQKGVTQDSKTDVDLKSRIQAYFRKGMVDLKSKIQAARENGDSQNGAQNEASMGDQKGETRTDMIQIDLRGGMQDDKSANDSKTEMQSEGVTHISNISCLEPQLKNDQGTSANGEGSSVIGAKNTAESSTSLPTMPQSEEATTIGGGDPGSDVKTIQTSSSKSVHENGTTAVPVHVHHLDNPLPMKTTANEDQMQHTSSAPSCQDNAARDGKDPDNQNEGATGINLQCEINNTSSTLNQEDHQHTNIPALLSQQEKTSTPLQSPLASDADSTNFAGHGGGMEGRNTRVESDDETVVKHKQFAASPPVAAVLTADSGNGVLPDDRIRQDPKNTNGQMYRKPTDPPELLPASRRDGNAAQVKHDTAEHQKTTGKVDTSGFDYAQADSIVVTFHVLFPHEMWGWNERNKLVMFFGGQNLGNWRAGMGNFAARDIGDGLWEMTTILSIQADLLQSTASIPYKYGVQNCMSGKFMLKGWIYPILDIVKNTEESGKKVMAAIIIICIVCKLLEMKQLHLRDIPVPYAAIMLQMLCLRPDLENKKCLDYDFVRSVIPYHYVKEVTNAISELVLHFLNDCTKPFGTLDLPITELMFTDPYLKLGAFYSKIAAKNGFFMRHFEKLKTLLCIDPIMQCGFTYVCPLSDRSHLIHYLSPYLCIGIMVKRLKETKELTYWSTDLVLQHIKEITLALKSSVHVSNFSPLHMLEATVHLLYALPRTMTYERHDHCLNLHKAIVILIFTATLQLSADTQQACINDAVTKVHLYFSDWICFTKRDIFGGERYVIERSAVAELKIWVSLFGAECPVECTHYWHGVIKNIVESRVNKLNPENRINLLCAIVSHDNTPDSLVNIFTEAAIAALDMLSEKGWLNTEKSLEKMCSEASKKNAQRIGRVLTSLVKKSRYHLTVDRLIIVVIVGWKDFAELKKELQNDISKISIGSLCSCNKEGSIVFHCLKSASPLHDMLGKFFVLNQNDLFIQLWEEKMAECGTISIPIVAQQVWPKAYSHAQQLMEALHGRTLKLADVDRYLSKYKTRVELGQILENLNNQLSICMSNSNDGKWIANVVETIVQYWSLKEHEKAAKTFLLVKEQLKLTGNFKQVEALAAQVSSSMKDQTLQVVDESLVGVGQFLQSFMTGKHREKLSCLETFITCQDVVQWLREVTKDVVDLQSFVNVSLTTSAGEGDLANDKLSALSIVGTGYRSLIYELKLDASFETLSKSCTTIWKALDENPNLPKLLMDCNSELEWYKSVKATQGRVEVTSFELMRNILQYGRFTIESHQGCNDIHDVVHVDLDDKKLAKKNFTLDELRDLESKLVLITGSKTEQRTQVDLFLDTLHSICHIADILLSLQQAGNVQYLRWRMDIPCTDKESLVDKLQGMARKMEDDLKKWNEEVKGSRSTFYELNNYTTAQLVKLRKELGKMRANGGVAVVEPGVMLLLQSISPDLTPAALKDSVLNFLMEAASPENQRTEAMLCSQHGEFSKQPVLSGNENLNAHHQPPSAVGPLNVNRFETNVILDAIESDAIKPTSSRLTIEQLTGKLKDAFINLTSTYGFPPRLVLSALEQCGEDKYAAEDWCNEHLMAFTESEAQLDDEATYPESREEQMDQTEQESESQSKAYNEIRVQEMDDVQPKEVTVITMRPIDASHASVIELMENGYSEEDSIRAAQRFGGNILEALNFLLSTSDGELFHGETMEITECHQVETTRLSEVIIYNASDEKHTTTEFLTLSELGSLLRELSSDSPGLDDGLVAVVGSRTVPSELIPEVNSVLAKHDQYRSIKALNKTIRLGVIGFRVDLKQTTDFLITLAPNCHPGLNAAAPELKTSKRTHPLIYLPQSLLPELRKSRPIW